MRLFSILMACYLLALCALPCGDSKECEDQAEHQVSVNAEHKEHEHSQEICTPFCYCACCAASVIYQALPLTSDVLASLYQQQIFYKIPHYNNEFHSFWQPPKLV